MNKTQRERRLELLDIKVLADHSSTIRIVSIKHKITFRIRIMQKSLQIVKLHSHIEIETTDKIAAKTKTYIH